MGSDEERLEEMLKAVMETEKLQQEDTPVDDLPDIPMDDLEDISMDDLPDIPFDDLEGMSFEDGAEHISEDIPDIPAMPAQKAVEQPTGGKPSPEPAGSAKGAPEGEDAVDPLAFLSMSEDEIDKVLEKEAAMEGGKATEGLSGRPKGLMKENSDLSDIEELLQMSDEHVPVAPDRTGDGIFEDSGFGGEETEGLFGGLQDTPKDSRDIPETPEEAPTQEKRKKKEKKVKEKKVKEKKVKEKKGKGEKEGLGKRLAAMFFGPDEEESEEAVTAGKEKADAADGKADAGAGGKKKKKEKPKKPPKKEKEDPKKAAKEKKKKELNAEKAKKKAEKAEKAEKERRAAKKLPKKKVIVWVLFCASIGAGVLLMNSIGMATVELTEARTAYDERDFETAYKLLNGRELEEEDQLVFRRSSAVLHLRHAAEAYRNHLTLGKPVLALEDLLKGVEKYRELSQTGEGELVTPELTAEYQGILATLMEQYGVSEAGALEINAIEGDYEYSLQLEALVNGEGYQSQAEEEKEQEEAAAAYPELEDMLPGEEEFLDDSGD